MTVIAFLLGFGVAALVVPPKLAGTLQRSARRLISRAAKNHQKKNRGENS